jgi:hypothetical protein
VITPQINHFLVTLLPKVPHIGSLDSKTHRNIYNLYLSIEGMSMHFSTEKGMGDNEFGTGFLVHKRITSAVKRAEFVSGRMWRMISLF